MKATLASLFAAIVLLVASCFSFDYGPTDPVEALERAPGLAANGLLLRAKGSEEGAFALTGFSVASSGDGRYVAVGNPGKGSPKAPFQGGWNLYERGPGGDYAIAVSGSLSESTSAAGYALALSRDGSILAVGSPSPDGSKPGSIAIYAKPESGWAGTRVAMPVALVGFDDPGDGVGVSIAMDDEGSIIAFGKPAQDGVGRVMYLLRPNGGWGSVDRVVAGNLGQGGLSKDAYWGSALAVSGDGSTIVVGAPLDKGKGMISIFTKPAGGWLETEGVVPFTPDSVYRGDMFGSRIALARDGRTIAVAAPGSYANGEARRGAVYLIGVNYKGGGISSLSLSGILPELPAELGFGAALSFAADGRSFAVSALGPGLDGAVYVYGGDPRDLASYALKASFADETLPGAMLGFALALSADGKTLIAGAPRAEGGAGAWKVFSMP